MLPVLSEKEWKLNALLLAFFFSTCVLQDHTVILIFLPQRNQNKLCLQRKDFYTFLLLCLTAEHWHCGMKVLVGGSCTQILAPEVTVEL